MKTRPEAPERRGVDVSSGAQQQSATSHERDVALVCGASADGSELAIIRQRAERLEASIVKKLQHGKPINGEVIRLHPQDGSPLCNVETVLSATSPNAETAATASPTTAEAAQDPRERRGHPAQVATPTYRDGWDAIWKRSSKTSKLLN